jgi:hypothetical protein
VRSANPDEYQDGVSAGSLARARRCWNELLAAGNLPHPQRFTFVFHCPTQPLAVALTDFLRYTHFAGFVRSTDRVGAHDGERWHVAGATHATVWSLSSLEHLFMRLRRAGSRYESALATLDLLPVTLCLS